MPDTVTGADAGTLLVMVLGIGNPVMGDDDIGLELPRCLVPELESVDIGRTAQAGDSTYLVWSPSSLDDPTSIVGRGDEWTGMIAYIDGGTCGIELLPVVQEAKNLLLLDALAGPGDPGIVVKPVGNQIPRLLVTKLSAHQAGLPDLLTAACLSGQEPEYVDVAGVVYEPAGVVVGLSNTALGGIEKMTEVARKPIDSWLVDERDNGV